MNKEDLLKQIAICGYNAGYGAKLSFSSLDMLRFLPALISFSSTVVGVLGIGFDFFGTKEVSAFTLCVGLLTYYINVKESDLKKFESSGVELTGVRNGLATLYYIVKSDEGDMSNYVSRLGEFEKDTQTKAISKQVFLSGWYAHFKFFNEAEVGWIVKELNLTFFKDKLPATFKFFLAVVLSIGVAFSLFRCKRTEASPSDSPTMGSIEKTAGLKQD